MNSSISSWITAMDDIHRAVSSSNNVIQCCNCILSAIVWSFDSGRIKLASLCRQSQTALDERLLKGKPSFYVPNAGRHLHEKIHPALVVCCARPSCFEAAKQTGGTRACGYPPFCSCCRAITGRDHQNPRVVRRSWGAASDERLLGKQSALGVRLLYFGLGQNPATVFAGAKILVAAGRTEPESDRNTEPLGAQHSSRRWAVESDEKKNAPERRAPETGTSCKEVFV